MSDKLPLKSFVLAWFGSCAMGCREPCQVRKEAAISGSSYVPQTSLLQRLRSFLRAIVFLCGEGEAYVYCTLQSAAPGSLR